jgi:hypothetical protein
MSKLDDVAEIWPTNEHSVSPAKDTLSWSASGVFWSGVRGESKLVFCLGRELVSSAVAKTVMGFG